MTLANYSFNRLVLNLPPKLYFQPWQLARSQAMPSIRSGKRSRPSLCTRDVYTDIGADTESQVTAKVQKVYFLNAENFIKPTSLGSKQLKISMWTRVLHGSEYILDNHCLFFPAFVGSRVPGILREKSKWLYPSFAAQLTPLTGMQRPLKSNTTECHWSQNYWQ